MMAAVLSHCCSEWRWMLQESWADMNWEVTTQDLSMRVQQTKRPQATFENHYRECCMKLTSNPVSLEVRSNERRICETQSEAPLVSETERKSSRRKFA